MTKEGRDGLLSTDADYLKEATKEVLGTLRNKLNSRPNLKRVTSELELILLEYLKKTAQNGLSELPDVVGRRSVSPRPKDGVTRVRQAELIFSLSDLIREEDKLAKKNSVNVCDQNGSNETNGQQKPTGQHKTKTLKF